MAPWIVSRATPTTLFVTRIAQLAFAIAYMCLLLSSNANRGWWLNLSWPIGFGCATGLTTLGHSCGNVWRYHSISSSRSYRPTVEFFKWLRVIVEALMMAMWTATFVTMLLPKGKDFRFAFKQPPYGTWDAAVGIASIQAALFFSSAIAVLKAKDPPSFVGNPV